MPSITLTYLHHRGKEWVAIKAPYKESVNQLVKKLGARWTRTYGCWLLPFSLESFAGLKKSFGGEVIPQLGDLKKKIENQKQQRITITKESPKVPGKKRPLPVYALSAENREAMRQFLQTLSLKAYSASTVRTYKNEFLQLLLILRNKPVKDLTVDELKRYLQYCMEKEGLKENTIHSRINALKFYFEQVLGRVRFFWEIPRPKKQLQLPKLLNEKELSRLFNAIENKKHKAMLFTGEAFPLFEPS